MNINSGKIERQKKEKKKEQHMWVLSEKRDLLEINLRQQQRPSTIKPGYLSFIIIAPFFAKPQQ